MKLSVAVITFNEEKNIERFLNSVNEIADEIVVIDSLSTDKTKEICEKFSKVRFIPNHFEGYGTQKNFAIENCKGEWILFPDADEVIDETAKNSIKNIISENPKNNVYLVELQNIFLGKHLKYGGWGNTYRERFFRKGFGKYSNDKVHEKFLSSDAKEVLDGKINHYTYRNISHHVGKINRYSSLMAEKYSKDGKSPSFLKVFITPFYTFLKNYFFQLGFLDGTIGFYAAITNSYYAFLKYMKLYEHKNQQS